MRHNAIPLFSIAATALLSGCITRTVEIRPVAPVVESRSSTVAARSARVALPVPRAPQLPGQSSGAGDMSRTQSSDHAGDADTPPGVRVEAVIPGQYSGRSLSFERDEAPK